MSRRLTIDITERAASEIALMRIACGLSTADIFRNAMSLAKTCVDELAAGHKIAVINAQGEVVRQLDLAIKPKRIAGD